MDGTHYAYARNLGTTLLALCIVGIAGCGDPEPMTGTDSGTVRVDSGRMGVDAGMPTDSGMAMVDSGRVKTDGGMVDDGGMVADGGGMKTDGGMVDDGGMAADGGGMKVDGGGTTDGGMIADASVGMDGGAVDAAMMMPDAAVARMCPDGDLAMALGAAVAMGTNMGSFDDAVSPCGSTGGEEMAYTWTAPAAGDYTFDTFGSTYDTTIHVHDGAMCDGPSLGCNDDSGAGVQSSLTVSLTAGQLVTIVVDAFSDTDLGDFVLNITAVPPCPDADLGSVEGSAVAMGTTVGEGADASGTCGGAAAEDVGFTWTAPRAGSWTFDTFGSAFDTILHVHDGALCDGTSLGCNDDSGTGTQSSVTATLTAGQTITLVVDGFDASSAGDYVLNISGPPIPGCITADLGGAVGAAVAMGMNAGAGDEVTSCAGTGGLDVAYTWTAPARGLYTFNTAGSSYDTVLSLQRGNTCRGTVLACNDDTGGTPQSSVTQLLNAGDLITIVIDGYSATATGSYVLNITQAPACPERALGSAEGPAAARGTTVGGGNDVSPSCGGTGGLDVGFTWTAPRAGSWTFDTFGSSFDTVLQVRDGAMCSGMSLACNDDSGAGVQSSVTVTLTAGQQIVLIVDGYDASESGDFVLNITGPAIAGCIGSDLGSATGAAVAMGTNVGAGNETQGSCGSTGGLDVGFTWTAPSAGSFTFDTIGSDYDTVIYVRNGATCAPPQLACNDDSGGALTSSTTVALTAGQTVVIVIDGYDAAETGNYVLNITAP